MASRRLNTILSVLAISATIGAALLLIYGTVVWCVDNRAPLHVLGMGIALALVAFALACVVADKTMFRRLFKPLLLGLVVEYALAFGTVGIGYVSERVMTAAMWLHYPGQLLAGLVFSDGSRSTIRRDIACTAIGEWLFIVGIIYLIQWYSRRHHAQHSVA